MRVACVCLIMWRVCEERGLYHGSDYG